MKFIDIPPIWLLGFCVVAWYLAGLTPGLAFGEAGNWIGTALVGIGIMVVLGAAVEFRRAKTTIVPGQIPNALITSGIFAYSRKPIYAADVMIFLALILRWDAWLALPLLPIFIWILRVRFITREEARLAELFPDDFAAYSARTRRWI